MINQDELRALLTYDTQTGLFTWIARSGTAKAGAVCTALDGGGYIQIRINRRAYKAHRLAWLYVHGRWPDKFIDHINCVRTDNRLSNLREVDALLNQQNQQRSQRASRSGLLGVSWHKPTGKWRARISVNKTAVHLGSFDSAEEAHAVYLAAKRKHHPGCAI